MDERGITAPLATVIAAVCAIVGGVAGAGVKGWFDSRSAEVAEEQRTRGNLELERAKFQTELILKAIDTEDQQTAVKTLTFFAEAGLIPNYEERVLALAGADQGSAIPTLRSAPDFLPIGALVAGGELDPARLRELGRSVAAFTVDGQNGRFVCTAALIGPRLALVPDFCVVDGADPERMSLRLDFDALESEGEPVSVGSVRAIGNGLTLLRLDADERLAGRGLALAARAPKPGEALFMIHHPLGGPKQVSPGCFADEEAPITTSPTDIVGMVGEKVLDFVCRTRGGSAGAPVLAASDGAMFGIHTARDMTADDRVFAIPTDFVKQALLESGDEVEAR